MFNESNIFLIISIVVAIAGYVIIKRFHVSSPRKFELLLTYLGGISVLLITYNIYIDMRSNKIIEKNRMAYNTLENTQRNFLLPQKELIDNFPEGYFLYASMNQDTNLEQFVPKTFDPVKRQQLEVYCSIRFFQAMEDFLSTAAFDITGSYSWINNFLIWLQSPILQEYWKDVSFNYADDTYEFVNSLIEKANGLRELRKKKGKLTREDYVSISKNFKFTAR